MVGGLGDVVGVIEFFVVDVGLAVVIAHMGVFGVLVIWIPAFDF